MNVEIDFYEPLEDDPEDHMDPGVLEQIRSLYEMSFREEISWGSDFNTITKDSSFIVASSGSLVLGYLDHYNLDDEKHENTLKGLENLMIYRELAKIGDRRISYLMESCEKTSGQKSDISLFVPMSPDCDILGKTDMKNDLFLDTIVVHPDFRGKGISRTLIECLGDYDYDRNVFCYTRNTNLQMQHILPGSGFIPLFQFGPVFHDRSCHQIWVKEKDNA